MTSSASATRPDNKSTILAASSRSAWQLRAAALVAAAAFAATHIPPAGLPGAVSGWDKVAHLIIYAALGGTIALGLGLHRRPRAVRFVAIFAALAGYGAFDELSQPFFGRTCELGDWIADLGGAALGLAGVWVSSRLFAVRFGRRLGDSAGGGSPLSRAT